MRAVWDLAASSREADLSWDWRLAAAAPRLADGNLEWLLIVACRDSLPGATPQSLNCWEGQNANQAIAIASSAVLRERQNVKATKTAAR